MIELVYPKSQIWMQKKNIPILTRKISLLSSQRKNMFMGPIKEIFVAVKVKSTKRSPFVHLSRLGHRKVLDDIPV